MRDLAKRRPASHPSHLTQVLSHVFVFLEELDPHLANLTVNSYPKPGGRSAWSQTAPGIPHHEHGLDPHALPPFWVIRSFCQYYLFIN